MSVIDATKKYVCDDRFRLRLFDAMAEEVRRVLARTGAAEFSVDAPWSEGEFRRRVGAFDELLGDLCRAEALLGRWGTEGGLETLTLGVRRLSDPLAPRSGTTFWLALRWYPVFLLFYAAGVAAVTANRYGALRGLMHARVSSNVKDEPIVTAATQGMADVAEAFKLLPGLERFYVPRSEHLHATLGPLLDEMLFLGADFERAFDRFEVLYAVEYAHVTGRGWGPVGRFGWKARDGESSPLDRALAEAEELKENWEPLKAGFCGGSVDRFKTVLRQLAAILANSRMV